MSPIRSAFLRRRAARARVLTATAGDVVRAMSGASVTADNRALGLFTAFQTAGNNFATSYPGAGLMLRRDNGTTEGATRLEAKETGPRLGRGPDREPDHRPHRKRVGGRSERGRLDAGRPADAAVVHGLPE